MQILSERVAWLENNQDALVTQVEQCNRYAIKTWLSTTTCKILSLNLYSLIKVIFTFQWVNLEMLAAARRSQIIFRGNYLKV